MPSTKTTPSSPQLLSPDSLETDLLTHLAQTTALEDLHTTLLSSLQRLGWTEKIRKLSLELLRAGRCERFDDVVEAVVASAAGMHPFAPSADDGSDDEDLNVDVRIPKAVVEQGVRALKEVLRDVIVLDDDPDLTALQQSERAEKTGSSLEGEAEKEKEKEKEKPKALKNGDPSPTKKMEKKTKPGKQVK
ncbi:uncharacterized protein ACLA_076090 [Aspergillus clavatus NRRL 1]|uniref:Uncharacterized protein n=1 Tax=Aspergillus clavatus (strain ATCC 1007 / CBS 513.65 / DSM 816 / NCTC 3887 / NRRL 1 / QM 1276 / 107) TaxID=344612 RepID=A1C848_ASPCL|nr:uncharacterized protein ACLA_076090 [Aspergillus clavatus NRRL 1]EAW14569.1 conserved hypothetical protein [Aspergillus clavatus NRRL 1]